MGGGTRSWSHSKGRIDLLRHAINYPFDALRQQATFCGSTALNMADTSDHAMAMQANSRDESDACFANAVRDANPYLHTILQ
ncbi:MAG: hypothetical protein AAF231_05325 [Pseudomonadota bacterium]